jgi:hypothetical protein
MIDQLTLDRWDGLSPKECAVLARQLAQELPAGFAFRSVNLYKLGRQKHHVAEYDYGGASFALIPGGAVTLGYDADRPWKPTREERESWQDTVEEYGVERTLQEYIAGATLRPRAVELRPFLMETAASELGWDPVPADDPDMKEIRRFFEEMRRDYKAMQRELGEKAKEPHEATLSMPGGSSVRVRRAPDGTLTVERAAARTDPMVAARLARAGFRRPTSDEWEYACGAGAATLFRWGDHAPCDRYPVGSGPEGADWNLHRQPNAFGVYIASNPYKYELVAEPGITRGGDGGCTICGGAGFFVGWLTLATAYFEEHACRHNPKEPIMWEYTVCRRVLSLG